MNDNEDVSAGTDADSEVEAATPDTADLQEQQAAELASLRDQVLRAAAEMDNLRKRTARELQETRAYAVASFARDMLTATDSLARAVEALPEDERRRADGTLKALIEGVELTEREMQRLLEKHGIARIEAKGQKFDPHFHQAMFEIAETDAADNTVVEVVQDGYVIGERVLRPAMVGVARSGRKEAGPETTADGTKAGEGPPEDGGIDKTA